MFINLINVLVLMKFYLVFVGKSNTSLNAEARF